jgi:hypothetical protein
MMEIEWLGREGLLFDPHIPFFVFSSRPSRDLRAFAVKSESVDDAPDVGKNDHGDAPRMIEYAPDWLVLRS